MNKEREWPVMHPELEVGGTQLSQMLSDEALYGKEVKLMEIKDDSEYHIGLWVNGVCEFSEEIPIGHNPDLDMFMARKRFMRGLIAAAVREVTKGA